MWLLIEEEGIEIEYRRSR